MGNDQLSVVFAALADPTRRAILSRLAEGDANVAVLASPFKMSQPAISRHLKVLEQAGLISRRRRATMRLSRIEAEPLREATAWLARYREFWDESYDRLDTSISQGRRPIMIDAPHVTRTTEQPTAYIHLTIPRAEIQNVMGPGIGEVMGAVAAQGITPTGPWLTHHLRMDPDTFDFEICVPIPTSVEPVGRVKAGRLPAAKIARTVYHGSYEGLGAAWGEFEAWIVANGHTSAPDLWECYLAGPESGPNPADWRTELNRPLIG
jgi:DNA-binding transcriptional ArsR family regulator/effector-binding domain-containing protein